MSNAALKDLVKTVGRVLEGWTLPADARKMLETDFYPAIAALSAVEGEAVPVAWQARSLPDGDWMEISKANFHWLRNDGRYEVRTLYTAPPPQQAASIDADALLVAFLGRKPDASDTRWNQMRRAVAEVTRNGMVRRVLETHPNVDDAVMAGTHPTPSPGPQGGGEVVDCEDCGGRGHTDNIYPGSDFQPPEPEACRSCEGSGKWRLATPPAHQPGEVVKLTPELIEAGWHETFSTNNPFCPCDLKSFGKAARWAERALAPKENGHGPA